MIQLGQYATLEVVKTTDFGVYLDGGPFGEVLLPKRYVPEGTEPGHDVDIFLYCDSEDRVIATTEKPFAKVGDIAYLRATDLADHGAFMDWGLMKDLFVPKNEQSEPMEKDKYYFVKVLLDETTDRIYGSSKLPRYLQLQNDGEPSLGEEVKLMAWVQTDLGFKMIINDQYIGLLFRNEVFQSLNMGKILRGYIKTIREDGRMDVTLQKSGYGNYIDDTTDLILNKLKENNGFLPITDSSAPNEIYDILNMSKKTFKKAVGSLYKQRLIGLEKTGIRLLT
jgi:uncharacterized protein